MMKSKGWNVTLAVNEELHVLAQSSFLELGRIHMNADRGQG